MTIPIPSPTLLFLASLLPITSSFQNAGRTGGLEPSAAARLSTVPPAALAPTSRRRRGTEAMMVTERSQSPFSSLLENLPWGRENGAPVGEGGSGAKLTAVENFFDAWNERDMIAASDCFAEDCEYTDTRYYGAFEGRSNLKHHLLLEGGSVPPTRARIVDDTAASADGTKVCVLWHVEDDGIPIENGRGCSFFTVGTDDGGAPKIRTAMDVPEPKSKPGDAGLSLLNAASKVIDGTGVGYIEVDSAATGGPSSGSAAASVVERYFDAWNRRDMASAVACFAEDCRYEDTQYPDPFVGGDRLEAHLRRVADCLPRSFAFAVDDLAVSADGRKVGVRWHLEDGSGQNLPFTRGCSLYSIDETGLISAGFDVPEPAVVKTGSLELGVGSIVQKLKEEPVRLLPLSIWVAYMYVVFLSDGILPGANALMLEQRTWEEVRDLSLNFFLVSPLLKLPFAPVVHPMLEGIFNVLLSWAAMFAGFLSDEREDKPNLFPMLPAVVGMQFLTSAFLLPYLGTRTSEDLESGEVVDRGDLPAIEGTIGEYGGLGVLLGSVGTGAIFWSFFGRPEFGPFGERYASLIDLLSIDRVGSSFVVDLVIFGLFQGWLVDDDMRRRGIRIDEGEMAVLRGVAKFLPFFGLAAYLTLRSSLPSRAEV